MWRDSGLLIILVLAVSVAVLPQASQRGTRLSDVTTVMVIVLDHNNQAVKEVQVELLSGLGSVIRQTFTNDLGQADLGSVETGNYKIRASGPEIEPVTGNSFLVRQREGFHSEVLLVTRKPQPAQASSAQGTVSAEYLGAPAGARAEFDKGMLALKRGDWEEARKRFAKATELHPKYSAAYNNLGIACLRAGRIEEGRNALRQAIALGKQAPEAYRNLATLEYSEGRFREAEAILRQSTDENPHDPESWTLLAKVQLVEGKMDEAIASARNVHAMPHAQYGFVHFIAATAFRAKKLDQEAMAEYELFLREAPSHASAATARAAMEALRAGIP